MLKSFFGDQVEFFQGSAPGRMDVMGGIADYSGSMVLQKPISQRTTVSLALRSDYIFRVMSSGMADEFMTFTIDARHLLNGTQVPDYTAARKAILQKPGGDWAIYVLGCILVLVAEKRIAIKGADVFIQSEVPLGKGVSSSAALEVATMKALSQAFGLHFTGTNLPILAQKAENLVVGAPCGLMDQLASFLGEPGKLLPILCQPDQVSATLPIPQDVHFLGIDSGVKHAVGGASYGDVRTAAFMGYTIIALSSGATLADLEEAKQTGNRSGLPFGGYLANISPSDFETQYKHLLPERMTGEDFKDRYGISIDHVTTVNPFTEYQVRVCTQHPVYENFRVKTFKELIHYLNTNIADRESVLSKLGELMYQSHASYSACNLGNPYTDELVAMVKAHKGEGVYGAKITGGGSGGTVCILCDGEKGKAAAQRIYDVYVAKYGLDIVFFE